MQFLKKMLVRRIQQRLQLYLIANDIRDAMKLAYIFSKVLLLCPYTFKNDCMFVIKKIDILFIILQISVLSWLNYDLCFNAKVYLKTKTGIDKFISFIQIFEFYIIYLHSMTYMHVYRKRVSKLLIDAIKYSDIMRKIGFTIDYKYNLKRSMFLITYLLAILSILTHQI